MALDPSPRIHFGTTFFERIGKNKNGNIGGYETQPFKYAQYI